MEFGEDRWLFWVGAILYWAALLMALTSLRSSKPLWRTGLLIFIISGFVFQSLGLFLRGLLDKSFPLNNPFEVLQVLAWSAIALDLTLRPIFRLRLLNLFSAGLAASLGLLSLSVSGWDFPPAVKEMAGSPWVEFHAVLAVFSYAVFGILAITSLMYMIQHYGLEQRRSGGIYGRLPAIRQLEDINGKLIVLGVTILTLSVAIGALDLIAEPGTVGLLKLLVALAVWLCYVGVLTLRKCNRLVAAPFAITCVCLFVGALLSLWPLTQASFPGESASPTSLLDDAQK